MKDEGALALVVAEDVVAAAAKQVRDDDAAVWDAARVNGLSIVEFNMVIV